MKSINLLVEEIRSIPENDFLVLLGYYRSNQLTLLTINPNESEVHFQVKYQSLASYGRLLTDNGNFSEAFEILKKSREILESNPFKTIDLDTHSTYRNVLFDIGRSCFYTQRIQTAQHTFNKLLKYDPTNDLYKRWVGAIAVDKYAKIDKILLYAFIGWLVIDIFFGDIIPMPYEYWFLGFGSITLLGTIALSAYMWWTKRRIKQ